VVLRVRGSTGSLGKLTCKEIVASVGVIRIENCLSSCQICRRFDSIAEVAQCTDRAQCALAWTSRTPPGPVPHSERPYAKGSRSAGIGGV
jgi:hypothetical protein